MGDPADGITYDSEVLRAAAEVLITAGGKYKALATTANGLGTAAKTEAGTFTTTYGPAPVYNDTVSALVTTGTKYRTEVDAFGDTLIAHGESLKTLATALDNGEQDAVDKFNNINPDAADPSSPQRYDVPPLTGDALTDPGLTDPMPEGTPTVQTVSHVVGGNVPQGPYDITGPYPVQPGNPYIGSSPYDEPTGQIPVYDPSTAPTGPYPRPT